jgi:hypothetical protein
MARGRKPNLAKRIAGLIEQLKDAIIAQEQSALVQRVKDRVDALVAGLRGKPAKRGPGGGGGARKRRPRSAASRRKQAAAMKAYWARRKAAGK